MNELNNETRVHDYKVIINAREKQWYNEKINFEELVVLAFGTFDQSNNSAYTITYSKGVGNHHEGILVHNDSVEVKNKMIFNVTKTDKS